MPETSAEKKNEWARWLGPRRSARTKFHVQSCSFAFTGTSSVPDVPTPRTGFPVDPSYKLVYIIQSHLLMYIWIQTLELQPCRHDVTGFCEKVSGRTAVWDNCTVHRSNQRRETYPTWCGTSTADENCRRKWWDYGKGTVHVLGSYSNPLLRLKKDYFFHRPPIWLS